MAAGLVSHNITTAAGVTFAIVSWVPNTGAPDVGAVPVAMITDGTDVAQVTANGLSVDIAASIGLSVTSLVPGTGAGNLGKAEDGTHTSGDTGTMALAVRQDAESALAANGKYIPLSVDANGYLRTVLNPRQVDGGNFKACPASSTTTLAQAAAGATGDNFSGLIITPLSLTGTGVVQVKNGSASAVTVFNGGDVPDLRPIPLFGPGLSTLGAWSVICGANIQALATGTF